MNPLDDLDHGLTLRGLRAGMKVFGRYQLIRKLGQGGMGVVWLAHDGRLDLEVALKLLPESLANDEAALDDLRRETRRCMKLNHPHIVRVYDLAEGGEHDTAAIAMEYVEGKSLTGLRLERPNRVFEVVDIESWVRQVCEALEYAHTEGKVVHRDLKPANLMVSSRLKLHVMDFGIAGSLGDSMSRVSKASQARSGGGTLPYMSPEQLLGYPASVGDDVYGLGATIYELLTGKPPFYSGSIERQIESITPASMMERRRELKVEGGEMIPEAWERVVAACLEKEAEKRPRSVREVWEGLSEAQGVEAVSGKRAKKAPSAGAGRKGLASPIAAKTTSPWRPAPEGMRRWMKRLGIGVVGLVVALVVTVASFLVAVSVEKEFFPRGSELMRRAQFAADAEQRIRKEAEVEERLVEGGDWNEGRVGEVRQAKLPGGVALNFGYCPAGSFVMGSPASEADRGNDENQVQVTISQGFWTGIYEVTQRQWEAVMGSNPSRSKGEYLPVEQVSWEEAQAFIVKLNQGGGLPGGWKYALPSEAQWEYACRAGTDSAFAFGNRLSSAAANIEEDLSLRSASKRLEWWPSASAVGSYQANGWGLYDMHGNVYEWCADWYGEKLEGGTDPVGALAGSLRVFRGGSWYVRVHYCRSANRDCFAPRRHDVDLGFRVAAVPAGAR
jgi:formylglycine-generating enzyme required for sulfatase activity